MKIVLVAATLLSITSSFADQCAYVSKDQAQKALRVALDASKIQTLCEPCGEKKPSGMTVKSIGIRAIESTNYWELQVNEQGLDLAYTYVNGMNLSKLAGCPSHDVSLSIGK